MILKIQRDWGNRSNRSRARLKYTIEDHGLENFKAEINKRLGFDLAPARPYTFTRNGDHIGWRQGDDKKWHLTLYIDSGRIKDTPGHRLRSAIRAIADLDVCDFVMTANQNLIFANVGSRAKGKIDKILAEHGVAPKSLSGARRNSIACVALPTCALALAESERYLPHLLTKIEGILDKAGLTDEEIVVRMTGCPNGCGRPYLGEIGFVGRSPGLYNLYLGAAFDGARMNKLYAQDVDEERALALLEPILLRYAKERQEGEHFGDFTIRAGYVKPTLDQQPVPRRRDAGVGETLSFVIPADAGRRAGTQLSIFVTPGSRVSQKARPGMTVSAVSRLTARIPARAERVVEKLTKSWQRLREVVLRQGVRRCLIPEVC